MFNKIYFHQIKPNSDTCVTTEIRRGERPSLFSYEFRAFSLDVLRYSESKGFYMYSSNPSPICFLENIVSSWEADVKMKESMLKSLTAATNNSMMELEHFKGVLNAEKEKANKPVYLYRFNETTGEITVEETLLTPTVDVVYGVITEQNSEYQMCSGNKDNSEFIRKMISYLFGKYQNIQPLTSESFSVFSTAVAALTNALKNADAAVKPYAATSAEKE